ncbi:hypothetical protein ABW19_dt0209674 [Dactylella cylindrospora]|nr:hypothetical protein ABW19_dt0209674 [Dactylella cylindrospora]
MSALRLPPNFEVKEYKGNAVVKRQWNRKESWDHIKDFVISEVAKKRSQKAILASLHAQGISIERYQLQRLLKKWGVADRNLRQKHRKYIFDTESRLQREGKTVRTWRFGDTRSVIKSSQLESIRQSNGREFENLESSPGNLVFSPVGQVQDGSTISIVTHLPSSNAATPAEKPVSPNTHEMHEPNEANALVRTIRITPNFENLPLIDLGLGTENQTTTITLLSGSKTKDAGEDDVIELSPLLINLEQSDDENWETEEETILESGGDASDIPEILEQICSDLARSLTLENTKAPLILSKEADVSRFCEMISLPFRQELEEQKQKLLEHAGKIVGAVEKIRSDSNRSYQDCERIYIHEMQKNREYQYSCHNEYWNMSYQAAAYIKYDTWNAACTIINPRLCSLQKKFLEDYHRLIVPLWYAVGSDEATFEDSRGSIVYSDYNRGVFRSLSIHIPHLIARYGITNYLTIFAMLQFFDYVQAYGIDFCEYRYFFETLWEVAALLSQFGASPQLVGVCCRFGYINATHGNLLEREPDIIVECFAGAKQLFGEGSPIAIRAATICVITFHGLQRTKEVQAFSRYIMYHLKRLERPNPMDFWHFNFLADVMDILVHAGNNKNVIRGENIFAFEPGAFLIEEGKTPERYANQGVLIMWSMARAYRGENDYPQALRILHKAINQFLDVFYTLYGSKGVIDLVTEVMTERGMVRYSVPAFERLINVYESKGDLDKNSIYRKILFALGSASFQLYLEGDKRDMARAIMPYETLG